MKKIELNVELKRSLDKLLLQKQVIERIKQGWSPEQIAGRLKLENNGKTIVCHETIYSWIYEDNPWTDDEQDLYQYLRFGHKKRKKQKGRKVHKSKIPNRVSISQRPDIVDQRIEFGHFEGDSVLYARKQAISTQNELLTGKVTFTKLAQKTAMLTAKAHTKALKRYQVDGIKVHSLTLDNGSEHTLHDQISQHTGVSVYFAHPYSSWERGANENVNMLLRGYLPGKS